MDNKLILSIIKSFLILLFIVIVLINTSRNVQCSKEEEATKMIIKGKVIRAFLDSTHHSYETLDFVMDGEEKRSYIFLFEKSGCFEYLEPGDSITKEPQSLVLKVFRNNRVEVFNLNYGCVNK
jgi:hypothetical protein